MAPVPLPCSARLSTSCRRLGRPGTAPLPPPLPLQQQQLLRRRWRLGSCSTQQHHARSLRPCSTPAAAGVEEGGQQGGGTASSCGGEEQQQQQQLQQQADLAASLARAAAESARGGAAGGALSPQDLERLATMDATLLSFSSSSSEQGGGSDAASSSGSGFSNEVSSRSSSSSSGRPGSSSAPPFHPSPPPTPSPPPLAASHSRDTGSHSSPPQQPERVAAGSAVAGSSSSSSSSSSIPSSSSSPGAEAAGQPGHIPRSILIISFVSATLTMASCVFNTLLPIYMVTELRMSMRSMGMFEGFLEAFSYVVRMFSGVVSDMMVSRKSAITLGFAMGACAKFGMSGATTVAHLFTCKAVDRLANGVQAAPRDALISDLAPTASRSACYGFAQSMRKWGSFVGAGASFFLMKWSNNNYKLIFVMAATLSVASTLAFVFFVPSHAREQEQQQQQQPPPPQQGAPQSQPIGAGASVAPAAAATPAAAPVPGEAAAAAAAPQGESAGGFKVKHFVQDVLSMGSDFYRTLLVISLYGMGHINESMLEARAIEVGFGKAESTLVVAMLAFVIFLCAYPLGRLDDKYGPRVTFAVGMGALILGNLTLLLSSAHPLAVFGALAFLGVHWAVIQGPMLSIVVGLAPAHLRGTAFGIFYTVMAFTAVAANTLYGSVWTALSANYAFALSAGLMGAALLALPALLPATTQKPVMQRA